MADKLVLFLIPGVLGTGYIEMRADNGLQDVLLFLAISRLALLSSIPGKETMESEQLTHFN